MKFYDMKHAPNPRRVRIFLAEKGIELERLEIDVTLGENRSASFLAINPRGVIPTLVLEDGSIIDESVAICRYFELLHPEPNLMGKQPKEAAMIESWQRRIELDGMFTVAAIFRNSSPFFVNRAQAGNTPDLPQIPAMVDRGRALLPGFFAMLNVQLGRHEFVAGDRYTIADISALVTVDFARLVKMRIPEDHANTRRWYQTVAARPSAKA